MEVCAEVGDTFVVFSPFWRALASPGPTTQIVTVSIADARCLE